MYIDSMMQQSKLWLLDVAGGVVDFELKTRLRRLGITQPANTMHEWGQCDVAAHIILESGTRYYIWVLIRQLLPNVYAMLDIGFCGMLSASWALGSHRYPGE